MHSTYAPPPPSLPAEPPESPSVLSGLGQALRWLREKQSRKQYRVADDAGITKGMLSAYETGRQRPSLETLEKLLETLGCDLNDLHNALQLVNGRPEQIKGWRGWQTTGWPVGTLSQNGRPALGPLPAPWAAAGPAPRGASEICETAPPYGAGAHGDGGATVAGGGGGTAARPAGGASPELLRVLGPDRPRLAHEEEEAFGQMLEGFHSLLRYWHRAIATVPGATHGFRPETANAGPPPAAGAGGPEPTRPAPDRADHS